MLFRMIYYKFLDSIMLESFDLVFLFPLEKKRLRTQAMMNDGMFPHALLLVYHHIGLKIEKKFLT